jgi:Cu/Ag efflux pump CusA
MFEGLCVILCDWSIVHKEHDFSSHDSHMYLGSREIIVLHCFGVCMIELMYLPIMTLPALDYQMQLALR